MDYLFVTPPDGHTTLEAPSPVKKKRLRPFSLLKPFVLTEHTWKYQWRRADSSRKASSKLVFECASWPLTGAASPPWVHSLKNAGERNELVRWQRGLRTGGRLWSDEEVHFITFSSKNIKHFIFFTRFRAFSHVLESFSCRSKVHLRLAGDQWLRELVRKPLNADVICYLLIIYTYKKLMLNYNCYIFYHLLNMLHIV